MVYDTSSWSLFVWDSVFSEFCDFQICACTVCFAFVLLILLEVGKGSVWLPLSCSLKMNNFNSFHLATLFHIYIKDSQYESTEVTKIQTEQ